MRARKLRGALLALGAIVVMGVVGLWSGRMYGQYQNSQKAHEQQDIMDGVLDHKAVGLDVGNAFPVLQVWSPSLDRAWYLPELLPQGGLVFYVQAQCAQCADAVTALARAVESTELGDKHVVVLTSSSPDEMMNALAERGVELPIYIDAEDLMFFKHHVEITRSYYKLDSDGIIVARGAAGFDPAEYAEILQR
jgi:hypothetical protein